MTADTDPPITIAEAAGVSIWERLDPALHRQLMDYLDNNEHGQAPR